MKKPIVFSLIFLAALCALLSFTACDGDDDPVQPPVLDNADKEALLFMLEEEKLARDTYVFLLEKWNQAIFLNISRSEQSHMDAVANLLEVYNISYEIGDYGEFANSDLQDLYDELVAQGEENIQHAMTVGATIEDLDIVDLEDFMMSISNQQIKDVFSSLQCGSQNHLRSFVTNLELIGGSYSPQFLTEEWYEEIIESPMEKCGI